MFWWINVHDANNIGAIILTIITMACIGHVVTTFGAVARLVMVTSAMGHTSILPRGEEEKLLPHELTNVLLTESAIYRRLDTPVNRQYRRNYPRTDTEEEQEPLTYKKSLERRHPDIELDEDIV